MKKSPSAQSSTKTAARAPRKMTKRPVAQEKILAEEEKGDLWNLRLYVAGQTPRSLTAFSNLKKLCEQYLAGRYKIEVVDLVKHPHLAQNDQIVALPTLVRRLPAPIRRVIGDLSNTERVMNGIDLEISA